MGKLIMCFSKQKQPKAPELPPRSDDESIASNENYDSYAAVHLGIKKKARDLVNSNLSVDTDAIIRQVNDNLETSQTSSYVETHNNENRIPLPKEIDKSITIDKNFLETFRQV